MPMACPRYRGAAPVGFLVEAPVFLRRACIAVRITWQAPAATVPAEVPMAHAAVAAALLVYETLGHDPSHGLGRADPAISSAVLGMSRMAPSGSMRTQPISSPAVSAALMARVRSLAVNRAGRRGFLTRFGGRLGNAISSVLRMG